MKLLTLATLCFLVGFAAGIMLPRGVQSTAAQNRPAPFSLRVQEAVSHEGAYSANETESYVTDTGKFLIALRHAGLIYPEASRENFVNAWALLDDLSKQDRKNAAYLYFRLAVEVLAGHAPNQIEKTGYQILKAQYYKNPYTEIQRDFLRNHVDGVRSASVRLREFPQIDYIKIFSVTNEYLSKTQSVRKHLATLLKGPAFLDDVGAAYVMRNQAELSLSVSMQLNACPTEKILRITRVEKGRPNARFVSRGY